MSAINPAQYIYKTLGHHIEDGGPFMLACAELVHHGFDARHVELRGEGETAKRKKRTSSKTKCTRPTYGVILWAKPRTALICGDCREPIEADDEVRAER